MKAAYDDYVARGWVVHSFDIIAYKNSKDERKKKPNYHGISWAQDESSFSDERNALSIDTGRSNLIVIDVDLGGMDAYRGIEAACGGPWDTFTEKSGSGGLHIYFSASAEAEALNKSVSKCFTMDGAKLDIDLRGKGGVIWAAPSAYEFEGKRFEYTVINPAPTIEMPTKLVSYLVSLLAKEVQKRKEPEGRDEAVVTTKRRLDVDERIEIIKAANCIIRYLGHTSHSAEVRAAVWDKHDTFVKIGFALNNAADGTPILLPPYVELAKLSSKAEANVEEWCEKIYYTPPPASGARPGLKFLKGLKEAMLARSDGKGLEEMLALLGVSTDSRFIDGIALGHVDKLAAHLASWSMAKYRVALDVVQHDKPGNNYGHVWFRHNGALWVQEAACKNNYENYLRRHLVDEVLEPIVACADILTFHEEFHEKASDLLASLRGLMPAGSKVVNAAKNLLRDDQVYRDNQIDVPETFFKLLDSKHHLLGFNNGVMDMQTGRFYKAGDVPVDSYVSKSTGYDFPGDENGDPMDHAMFLEMQQVEAHMVTFFPREDIRMLFRLSMGMAAGAASLAQIQLFLIFWGHLGSNGKSVLLNWLGDVFGPSYLKSLDPGYLTHTADPNKPQSGLMEMRGVRIARINEANPNAEAGMRINNEFLKRWTGNDPIQMRGMYGNSVQTQLNAIPILVVNRYPDFTNPSEEAKLRREGLVPFESRFVDSVEIVNEDAYIFLKNKNIEKTFKKLVPAFALCLVKWGKELQRANLVISRPFTTYEQIQDYISDTTEVEPDAELYALGVAARTWLQSTFEACDPNKECPAAASATCPVEYRRGKPAGADRCPFMLAQSMILDEYRRVFPEEAGKKALSDDKFYARLRATFKVEKHVKNRHINARDVCCLKRKARRAIEDGV